MVEASNKQFLAVLLLKICKQSLLSSSFDQSLVSWQIYCLLYRFEKLVCSNENSIAAIMLTAVWSKSFILREHQPWFVQMWIQRHNLQKLFFFHSSVSSSIDKSDNDVVSADVPLIPFFRISEAIALFILFFTWHALVATIHWWLASIGYSCLASSKSILWQSDVACSFEAKLLKFTPPFMNAIWDDIFFWEVFFCLCLPFFANHGFAFSYYHSFMQFSPWIKCRSFHQFNTAPHKFWRCFWSGWHNNF